MIDESLQLASTLNRKYLPGAKSFLKSLIHYNPNINFLYNFLTFDTLTQQEKDDLRLIYKNIKFTDIISSDYNYYNTNDKFRAWKFNCFNRFDIFLLKSKKIIFFDLDMIVNSPLNELFNLTVDFAAVEVDEKNRLDHPSKQFFDGGLMFINKNYITHHTKNKLIELSKIKKWSSDEPVLNLFFENNVYYLPRVYNVLSYDFEKYKNNFKILQYVGSKKPWMGSTIEDCFDRHIINNNSILNLKKMINIYKKYEN